MTSRDANKEREQRRQRDAHVVQMVVDGERDMYRELVERYQTPVYTVALRLVGNEDDAHDISQLSFVAAYRALGRFDLRRSFYTWLMRIAVNKCKDYLKSHKRKEGHLTGEIPGASALFSGRMSNPEDSMVNREKLILLQSALIEMDPKYSIPLLLKEVEGMSYKQMREVLELPLTTLKIRVVRARQQLQEQMQWMNNEQNS